MLGALCFLGLNNFASLSRSSSSSLPHPIFSAFAMNTPPLHFTTTCSHPHRVNLSSPTAASSSEISCEEDDTPSCQLNFCHSQQLNQISPARVSHSAEEKGDELRPETTREHLVKSKSETTVDEKLEYAKILLGFAFPMLLSLVVAASEISKTTGARIAAIALSFALAFMGSGLPLRKTYPKISTACLIFGAILTMLSVYSLVFSSLPSHLKMILVLCGVVPLIALVLLSGAYFRRENKMKDSEEGARIISSDWKENNTRKHYRKAEQGLMEKRWKRQEKEEEERIMNEFLANPGDFRAVGEAEVVDEEEERIMNEFLANAGGVREVGEAGVVGEEEERIMNEFLASPGGVRAVGDAGAVDEEDERIMNEFLASLDEEAEFMKKKEIVMNIIPE